MLKRNQKKKETCSYGIISLLTKRTQKIGRKTIKYLKKRPKMFTDQITLSLNNKNTLVHVVRTKYPLLWYHNTDNFS